MDYLITESSVPDRRKNQVNFRVVWMHSGVVPACQCFYFRGVTVADTHSCVLMCIVFRVFGTVKFSRYYCSELLLPLDHVFVGVL